MIKHDNFIRPRDGVAMVCTFSDTGMKIRKVGTDEIYDEAVDFVGTDYRYTETEEVAEL